MKVYDIASKINFSQVKKLKPGENITFNFKNKLNKRYSYKLSLVSETDLPIFKRFEDVFAVYYRHIDDSLVKIADRYALCFNKENQVHERSCYYMVKDNLPLNVSFDFGVEYKARGINDNFKVTAEVYFGEKNTRYYYEKPDKIFSLSINDSEDFIKTSKKIKFANPVDFIMIKIESVGFTGNAEFFAPYLINKGKNYSCEFLPARDFEDFDWIGEGFSLVERPKFKVVVGDKVVFEGRKVETCDSYSGVEFYIPEDIDTDKINNIKLEFSKENVVDYNIKGARLIALPKGFEILGYDKNVIYNKPFGVLVNIKNIGGVEFDNNQIEYLGDKKITSSINVLRFVPKKVGKNIKFSIKIGNEIRYLKLDNVVVKNDDHVITGTGDAIYIRQDLDDFIEYLSWYLNNGVGKLLTFRSNYRWGRTSECNDEFWKKIVPLLCELDIYYSMMIDGRELNGANSAPDVNLIESKFFLGEQTHEMDGSYIYWGQDIPNSQTEIFYHTLSRKIKKPGIYGKRSPVYGKNGVPYMFYSPSDAKSTKDAYLQFADGIKATAEQGATRHTGVTPFFNTFFDAGYKWVGYESLYGTHELLFGAIRGISNSHKQSSFGAHSALQWSTMPLETKGHLLRYKISLNLSYMHGVTEINTEEGLWRFSNAFSEYDRFSKPCIDHLKIQTEFNRFVCLNERKGKIKTNIAMLMGKYDGMECFSASNVFGQAGDEWKKSYPEESWNLLKVFYPRADLNAIYYYIVNGGKANINEKDKAIMETLPGLYRDVIDDQSVGFYTETPYGPIDIISVDCDNYSDYKFLFFTGWNTAEVSQLKKLCKFVESGGTLLLAKPHLYSTVDRKTALSGKAKVINSKLVEKLLSYRDTGRVVFFDKDEYPAKFSSRYADALIDKANEFGCKSIRNLNRISYVEYQTDDGNVLYLQNIGWWTKEPATCEVNIHGRWKKVKVREYDIKIIKI